VWVNSAMTVIFNGGAVIGTRFQADVSTPYDIFATNVDSSYADTYTCTDQNGVSASANVVVFGEFTFYGAYR